MTIASKSFMVNCLSAFPLVLCCEVLSYTLVWKVFLCLLILLNPCVCLYVSYVSYFAFVDVLWGPVLHPPVTKARYSRCVVVGCDCCGCTGGQGWSPDWLAVKLNWYFRGVWMYRAGSGHCWLCGLVMTAVNHPVSLACPWPCWLWGLTMTAFACWPSRCESAWCTMLGWGCPLSVAGQKSFEAKVVGSWC